MAFFSTDPWELEVTVGGVQARGVLQASITNTNCFSSDTYRATFAMGPPPLCDISFWSTLSSAYVEINAGPTATGPAQLLISGMIDTVVADPIRQIVTIEGRDLSANLIDSYRQQDFVNQTASEVVSAVAAFHGFTPMVTPTADTVGRYYGDGYTRLSLGQFSRVRSDWDLVVELARQNSFDVFVQGSNLFFQPAIGLDSMPVRLSLSDVRALRFEHSCAVPSDATARVQSWNSQTMASYLSAGPDDSLSGDAIPTDANTQPYLFSSANYTSEQVTESAARLTAELNRLGMMLHAEMPWNFAISPRNQILIDETGSEFDATYLIESVERHYSTTSGCIQIVRATAI